jgi:hypothetical protein
MLKLNSETFYYIILFVRCFGFFFIGIVLYKICKALELPILSYMLINYFLSMALLFWLIDADHALIAMQEREAALRPFIDTNLLNNTTQFNSLKKFEFDYDLGQEFFKYNLKKNLKAFDNELLIDNAPELIDTASCYDFVNMEEH